MDFFLEIDAWLSGILFYLLMLAAWYLGKILCRRIGPVDSEGSTRTEDAAFALFGLLLAFCFSGAAGRYEARKEYLRADAIAIGDFATTASALEEPAKSRIHSQLVDYVKQRLVFGQTRFDSAEMPGIIEGGRKIQNQILAEVQKVISGKNTPTLHTPLMNGFNGLTSAHDQRLYGVQNRVPGNIIMMLVFFGLYMAFATGRFGGSSKGIVSWIRIGSHAALVALVFAVIIDLEQPRRGLLRVPQTPMQDLLLSLTGESANPGSR